MVQSEIKQAIIFRYQKYMSFLRSLVYFAQKNFRAEIILMPFVNGLKEFLSLPQKRKLSKYRLEHQIYRLRQMENLIAASNEHYFINGSKLNKLR